MPFNLARTLRFVASSILVIGIACSPNASWAQGKVTLARELVEQVARKFSKEVADEGTERLTARVQTVLAQVGEEGADAIRAVGPRAVRLLEDAGTDSALTARLLAKHGDEAIWIVEDPARRALVSQLGEEATEALLRHGSIAEKILINSGESAVGALKSLSSQNGRRLAMLADDPTTAALAKNPDVLAIVGRYGDRGMDFVWRNKGALAAGTALALFVANPEPFIDGTTDLAEIAASQIAKPMAEQIANRTQWTPVLIVLIGVIGFLAWLKWPRSRRASGA